MAEIDNIEVKGIPHILNATKIIAEDDTGESSAYKIRFTTDQTDTGLEGYITFVLEN